MSTLPLAVQLWHPRNLTRLQTQIILAVAGSLFIALSAQISVPMIPVPMTLQTLAVMMIGGLYGPRLGVATVALYLLEGFVGLPVFAGMAGGPAKLFGPTGGFLFGFILQAWIVGFFVRHGWGRNILLMMIPCFLAMYAIYVPGVAWLAGFAGGVSSAVKVGFIPFMLGDGVKACIVAISIPALYTLVDNKKTPQK